VSNDLVIGTDTAGSDTSIIGDGIHPTQRTHDYGYANYVVSIMAQITAELRLPKEAAKEQAA